jgi:predicted nuclease with TOPRIM domain|tara:strand:+ start:1315 stop:1581 length:267 start_codon:yes stop_codon:yes gene_type:complete
MTIISENTKVSLSPKNFITIIVLVGSMVGMYYSLQAQIEEAKELPKPSQTPTEQMIEIQKELVFIKTEMLEMKETLNRLDDRIYQLRK